MIIPVGFANATLQFSVTGRPSPLSFNIGLSNDGDLSPTALAEKVRSAFRAPGAPFDLLELTEIASVYEFETVNVTLMTATGPVLGVAPAGSQGLASFQPPPSNFSMLVRKNTARGGRKGRGRMFVPPFLLNETNVDAVGTIQPDRVAAIQPLWDAFLTGLTDLETVPVLFHDDEVTSPDQILSLAVQSLGATQRRRMR